MVHGSFLLLFILAAAFIAVNGFDQSPALGCWDEYPSLCEEFARNKSCLVRKIPYTEPLYSRNLGNYLKCWTTCFSIHANKRIDPLYHRGLIESMLGNSRPDFTDALGQTYPVCGGQRGMRYQLNHRANLVTFLTHSMAKRSRIEDVLKVGKFTEVGLKKFRLPDSIHKTLLMYAKSRSKWIRTQVEGLNVGVFSCMMNKTSEDEDEVCPREFDKTCTFQAQANQQIANKLGKWFLPRVEDWASELRLSSNQERVRLTMAVGEFFRKFPGTVERAHTHGKDEPIAARILLDYEKEWMTPLPAQFLDYLGRIHTVRLKPGEAIVYEAARIPHGLTVPLNAGGYIEELDLIFGPRQDQVKK